MQVGALLIADSGNHRVRRVAGGVITTVVGTGVQGFAGDGGAATAAELDTPSGLAVAADGRVFVADSRNHRVRVVATDGTIATFAGSGVRGFSGDGRRGDEGCAVSAARCDGDGGGRGGVCGFGQSSRAGGGRGGRDYDDCGRWGAGELGGWDGGGGRVGGYAAGFGGVGVWCGGVFGFA